MTLGEKIRDFRERHLLTMRKAAELFDVSQAEISRLEKGRSKPHFITVAKWEDKLAKAERKEK